MGRFALRALSVLAILLLLLPTVGTMGILMGFPKGAPDPNTYKTIFTLGWPLPWLTWEHSRNEAESFESSSYSFNAVIWLVHMAIAGPALLFLRKTLRSRQSADDT